MNENVFKEYDIRGIVENDFSTSFVNNLGRAYGTVLVNNNQKHISVSGDIRKTTLTLKNDFIDGLLDVGINVYDLGILPTPVNYFSLFNTDIHNSVQITGSHNPPEYNGFKLSFNKKPFFGKDIQKLKDIILHNDFKISSVKGQLFKTDIIEDYITDIKSKINIENNIRCVMDCGNATAGLIAPQLFKEFNIDLVELYCNIDDTFPNHHPDPTVDKNLDDLIFSTLKNKTNLGVAYDGDGDRVVAVDERGRIIRPDILMSIFIPYLVTKNDSIIYDVKCSRALKETILKYGGKPIMYKTGHSLIKNKMLETKSLFGGEMSGHLFFADKFYGFDDGIYASLRLIELLSKIKKPLSELLDKIPKYHSSPEIRIECKDDNEKNKIVASSVQYFKNRFVHDLIDGIRIEFENGWGLIRSSNTQPVIVCRFEANSKESLEEIQNLVYSRLKIYGDIEVEN